MVNYQIYFQNPILFFEDPQKFHVGRLIGDYFPQIIGGFAGGFFAAYFTNFFESKRRVEEKRRDGYFNHRNTIVQIEHELIPLRVNLSRDLSAIEDAIANTTPENIRIVLRLYDLKLSTGLSLKLLDMNLINKYAELYSLLESINSDIVYLSGLVEMIQADLKSGKLGPTFDSLIVSYIQMEEFMKVRFLKADKATLELVILCKLAFHQDDSTMESYIKNGGTINYKFSDKMVRKEEKEIVKQETKPYKQGEVHDQFFAPFMDLRRPK